MKEKADTGAALATRQERQKQTIVEHLKKVPICQAVCEKVGVARSTFYRWKKADEKFREAVDSSLCEGFSLVNDLAESQIINLIKDQNLTACIFWLKNHNQTYRDKIEVSAKPADTPLTHEQKETIKKALSLSPLHLNNPIQHEDKRSSDTAMPIRQKNQDSSST